MSEVEMKETDVLPTELEKLVKSISVDDNECKVTVILNDDKGIGCAVGDTNSCFKSLVAVALLNALTDEKVELFGTNSYRAISNIMKRKA